MNTTSRKRPMRMGAVSCALLAMAVQGRAADAADPAIDRLEALQRQVNEQTARIESLKRSVAQEEAKLNEVKNAIGREVLDAQRARGDAPVAQSQAPVATPSANAATTPQPVGQAPTSEQRAATAAQNLDLPGVLTPAGKGVLEPSLQYAYSSSNRVALVGYTVIPAILIGVIDVRETNRNTFNAALTGRYGVTNRFELEARVPYVYRSDTSVGREILQGAANNVAFDATGSGIGDVEVTGRYQFNSGGADTPFYVGALRLKTRTGTDPFEVETSRNILGLRDGVQTELPTGSGFFGAAAGLDRAVPLRPSCLLWNRQLSVQLQTLERDTCHRCRAGGSRHHPTGRHIRFQLRHGPWAERQIILQPWL